MWTNQIWQLAIRDIFNEMCNTVLDEYTKVEVSCLLGQHKLQTYNIGQVVLLLMTRAWVKLSKVICM